MEFFQLQKINSIAYEKKKIPSLQCNVYGPEDGMRSSEATGNFQPAGWKSSDGNLWFPTTNGVVRVHPGQITKNKVPPQTRIEEILIDQQAFLWASGKSGYHREKRIMNSVTPVSAFSFLKEYDLSTSWKEWIKTGSKQENGVQRFIQMFRPAIMFSAFWLPIMMESGASRPQI